MWWLFSAFIDTENLIASCAQYKAVACRLILSLKTVNQFPSTWYSYATIFLFTFIEIPTIMPAFVSEELINQWTGLWSFQVISTNVFTWPSQIWTKLGMQVVLWCQKNFTFIHGMSSWLRPRKDATLNFFSTLAAI